MLTPPSKNSSANLLNAIPTLITSFGFSDVRSATGMDFSKPLHVTAHTFDGLVLTLDVTGDGGWTRLSASAAPGANAAVAAEASAIDSRAAGWAYKLPADKGQLLMTDPLNPGPLTNPEPTNPGNG